MHVNTTAAASRPAQIVMRYDRVTQQQHQPHIGHFTASHTPCYRFSIKLNEFTEYSFVYYSSFNHFHFRNRKINNKKLTNLVEQPMLLMMVMMMISNWNKL